MSFPEVTRIRLLGEVDRAYIQDIHHMCFHKNISVSNTMFYKVGWGKGKKESGKNTSKREKSILLDQGTTTVFQFISSLISLILRRLSRTGKSHEITIDITTENNNQAAYLQI